MTHDARSMASIDQAVEVDTLDLISCGLRCLHLHSVGGIIQRGGGLQTGHLERRRVWGREAGAEEERGLENGIGE